MSARDEVDRILTERGATLKRHKKHEVWEFPDGKTFVRAKTPSDIRADDNNLTDLKNLLGIADPERGKPGERRERKQKTEKPRTYRAKPTVNTTLADIMRSSGVVEESLRDELAVAQAEAAAYRVAFDRCWMCRLRKWWLNLEE